jgi:hypothetical protein
MSTTPSEQLEGLESDQIVAGQLQNFTIDQFAGAFALMMGAIGTLLLVIWQSRCACKCRLGCSDKCYIFDCAREPPPLEEDKDKKLKNTNLNTNASSVQAEGQAEQGEGETEPIIPPETSPLPPSALSLLVEPEPEPEPEPSPAPDPEPAPQRPTVLQ